MLLTGSSFVCPNSIKFPSTEFEKIKGPLPSKFSVNGKCSKTNISLCFNYKENNCFKRNSTKMTAISNSDQLPVEVEDRVFENLNGKIGIVKFFEGKNIFITGATGFLGKVYVEKLLSSTGVGKIFLLVKAESKEAAFERLTNEIVNSELFKRLKEKHGKCYEAFVRSKLIPIVGNICEPNLGMESNDVEVIKREVNVIIESAAITAMNERYDLLLDANVNAPQRLLRFAKTWKNLKVFAHISTAFVNGSREGIIFEKPWTMGENARKDDEISSSDLPPLDPTHEIKLAFSSCNNALSHRDQTKELRRLGQERAELYGWNNVYTLTKAMGEMCLNEIKGDVPLLIIRPSIVESSYAEPFPGWIQGFRVSDPLIVAFGKGQFPALFGVPEAPFDIIPVDMVVNTTITAIAKHGRLIEHGHKPELSVYHVASSTANLLTYSAWFDLLYEYFNSKPLTGQQAVEKIKFIDNFNDYLKYTREEISRRQAMSTDSTDDPNRVKNQLKARVAYAQQLCKIYDFIGFFNARFHTGNTEKLLREMSEEEKINFSIDVTKIDWRKYFVDIHIPGVMKHLINGTDQ